MTITVANLENVPEIIALCYKNFAEIGQHLPKPDTLKGVASMSEFVSNGLVFVKKEENGKIVGILVLTPFNFWWSETTVLHTATLYVLPEYRDKNTFNELIEEAQSYADHVGTRLYFDKLIDSEALDVLIRRKGFTKTGDIYVYGNESD